MLLGDDLGQCKPRSERVPAGGVAAPLSTLIVTVGSLGNYSSTLTTARCNQFSCDTSFNLINFYPRALEPHRRGSGARS